LQPDQTGKSAASPVKVPEFSNAARLVLLLFLFLVNMAAIAIEPAFVAAIAAATTAAFCPKRRVGCFPCQSVMCDVQFKMRCVWDVH
jgi:hypothetical protein